MMASMTNEMIPTREAEQLLFGPTEGWRLAPVAAWLLTAGRRLSEPEQLMSALVGELRRVGAPLAAMGTGVRTLHPQVAAWVIVVGADGAAELQRRSFFSDHYAGSPVEWVHQHNAPFRCRLVDLGETDHPDLHKHAAAGLTDYLCAPLRFSDGRVNIGVFGTARPSGFTDADIAKFLALEHYLAPLLEIIERQRVARTLLDTYVGHRTGARILRGQIHRGDADPIHAVVWYSDLRDFTALNEALPAARLLAMLNAYFEAIAAAVEPRGGEILQFIGDAALVIFAFGDPEAAAPTAEAAVEAALDTFSAVAVLNQRRHRAGEPAIRFGIGLHIGEVMHGNVGSPDRLGFNVVGPAVNRTARLESLTKTIELPLLLSAELAARLPRPVRSLGRFAMKGVAEPQEVFALAEQIPTPGPD
jgi:adenylate cyclase